MELRLSDRELVGLYLQLRRDEDGLDDTLFSLYTRLQRLLYEELSIEEMESLENLYQEKIDIFHRRG
jgi:hypothetical protein